MKVRPKDRNKFASVEADPLTQNKLRVHPLSLANRHVLTSFLNMI